MDDMMASMAMASMSMASTAQATQYSMAMERKTLDAEMESAAQLLEMLPPVQAPQSGDIPAVMKGNFIDIYA